MHYDLYGILHVGRIIILMKLMDGFINLIMNYYYFHQEANKIMKYFQSFCSLYHLYGK